MIPQVISVKEGRGLSAANQIFKVIIVSYTVGPYGPFTWQGTQSDFDGGKAMLAMQAMAARLATLPTAPQS